MPEIPTDATRGNAFPRKKEIRAPRAGYFSF
jgi:hypothetical protein